MGFSRISHLECYWTMKKAKTTDRRSSLPPASLS
jgi:hypothetical protein